ncbi:rhombosortase [Aliikangiella marina]|nr:rhombosortase [Aliikangiella marina]
MFNTKKVANFYREFRLTIWLLLPSLVIQIFAGDWHEWLRYQQLEVTQGQWWRLITANFCHSNWYHFGLNMLGLVMIDYFYQPVINHRWRFWLMWFCLLLNVILLHWLVDLSWYVGMSGALHGYLIGGALITYFQYKIINSLIIVIVTGKLFLEMVWDINFTASELIEANVVEESHLFGALSAVFFYGLFRGYQYFSGHPISYSPDSPPANPNAYHSDIEEKPGPHS